MLGIGLTNGNVPKADTRESSSSALHQCNIISYNILNTSGTREPCETSDTSLTIETSETSDASQTLMVMCPKQTPVSLLPLHCTSGQCTIISYNALKTSRARGPRETSKTSDTNED